MQALKHLRLSAVNHDFLTPADEQFWSELARRGPNALNLTELSCPRLTPALVRFLCSFSGLEKLEFYPRFYPMIPSNLIWSDGVVQRDKDAELKLLDAFFNEALSAHKASLTYLALWEDNNMGDLWYVTPEYLERVIRCTSLRALDIPIQYPGDDLVCAP